MKVYLKVVLLIVLWFGNIGLVLPYLFSADSTELVMLGFANVVVFIPTIYFIVKSFFKRKTNV